MGAPRGGPLPAPMSGGYRCYNPSVFASLLVPLGAYVTGRYTMIWAFRGCPPHQSPDRELWLKVSWYGEPPSTATRQIRKVNEGRPRRLRRKPRAAGDSRPVEATFRDGQVDKTNRFWRWITERHSVNLSEVFRNFISCKANDRVFDAN